MDVQKFGTFLQSCRKELGMTQGELGAKLHVTDKAISRWERGVGFPDIQLLEPLADALQISIQELMQCQREQPEQAVVEENTVPKTKKETWFFRYRRMFAVLCFFAYLILWTLAGNSLLYARQVWLSQLNKVFFCVTAAAFMCASYQEDDYGNS